MNKIIIVCLVGLVVGAVVAFAWGGGAVTRYLSVRCWARSPGSWVAGSGRPIPKKSRLIEWPFAVRSAHRNILMVRRTYLLVHPGRECRPLCWWIL